MRIPTFTQFQRQASLISLQFDQMSRLQAEAASGKRIINASDDPLLSSQINTTQGYIDKLNGYSHNGVLAQNRGGVFNTTMQGAIDLISDIQKTVQSARSGTLNDSDRANMARQLKGQLSSLFDLANTQDTDGKYIFSGSNTGLPAYTHSGTGYSYQGGLDASTIEIGPNISTLFSESGNTVFGNIPTGNGKFTVTAGAGNTGTASTSVGTITASTYVPDTYTVTFVTNSAGLTGYQVVGATSGQLIPKPPLTVPADAPAYTPGTNGMDISFNGVNININGKANVGDTFQVQPSTKQDVFTTLQNAIDTLNTPIANQGSYDQAIGQSSAALAQVFDHFSGYMSDIGIRNSAIQNQLASNKATVSSQTIVLGHLSDADMTQVFSQLSQQSLALQATQQSYLKIQETLGLLLKI